MPSSPHKFTFGLWTVGNIGRDPFGDATRPVLGPAQIVELLGEVGGVHGINFHDNDLVPIDASEEEKGVILRDFRKALKKASLKVAMATTNLFSDPAFKDGAFTSNDAEVRAYALHKVMHAMQLGASLGAKMFVFWGGREGVEFDAGKDPVLALQRYRTAINFLCKHSLEEKYNYRFALEAKPNEPRGHIYLPTTGHCLAFIETLDHSEMVGVNPEVAHEHMAGLNFVHAVAQALDMNKLFHIDLNDQEFGRYDQDFRFGSANLKHAFFLVKLLEDRKWKGFRHFDSHAYRTSDRADVIEFARGSIRTYQLLAEKARLWNNHPEVKKLLGVINRADPEMVKMMQKYSHRAAARLLERSFDRAALAARPLPYERLDQLTMEILMGVV
ncbi:MAG: xylose isomerase [Phycisphaerales bacterium]